jgi:dihydroflavonol-4-reductase
LANEKCTSIKDTTRIAQQVFPQLKIKLPIAVPRPILYTIAFLMEMASKINGRAPLLSVKDISMYSGLQQDFDTNKAKVDLGFIPKHSDMVLRESMLYLYDNAERFKL